MPDPRSTKLRGLTSHQQRRVKVGNLHDESRGKSSEVVQESINRVFWEVCDVVADGLRAQWPQRSTQVNSRVRKPRGRLTVWGCLSLCSALFFAFSLVVRQSNQEFCVFVGINLVMFLLRRMVSLILTSFLMQIHCF